MTYNFINQDVASLEALRDAVYDELRLRFYQRIHTWPIPKLLKGLDGETLVVESVKLYRDKTACSLMEAKWIIDYYMYKV